MPPGARLDTLWIGPALGRVERACLRSALRQGHCVTLHCYERPSGVPEGVDVADAARILPRDRAAAHRGSATLFSNLFRYALMQHGPATWIDADIYLVAPIEETRPYLFGRQSREVINGAVLRLPSGSTLLARLVDLFDETEIPFWLDDAARRAAADRLRAEGRTGLHLMPWGSAGPNAITALSHALGVDAEALPERVFYPVPYHRASWIRDPAIRLADVVGPDTVAVHLWNALIAGFKDRPAAPGSFLARLHAEGA